MGKHCLHQTWLKEYRSALRRSLVFVGLLTACCASLFAAGYPTSVYAEADQVVWRLGLPHRYHAAVQKMSTDIHCGKGSDLNGVKMQVALGNDYQVLDWLENGKIEGGVIPLGSLMLLMEHQEPNAPDYLDSDDGSFIGVPLPQYVLSIRMNRAGVWQADPEAKYTEFLDSILRQVKDKNPQEKQAKDKNRQNIYVSSHLSAGLPVLLHYTDGLLNERKDLTRSQRRDFWKSFIEHIRFRLTSGGEGMQLGRQSAFFEVKPSKDCSGDTSACLTDTDTRLQDVLVIHQQAVSACSFPSDRSDDARKGFRQFWLQLERPPDDTGKAVHPITAFFTKNYSVEELGSRTRRHFRFTIDELWRILGANNESSLNGNLALLLTGGGVKAAYQTRLIDHLYNKNYLYNHVGSTSSENRPGSNALGVKYVIGTSGGALLGLFVSSIRDDQAVNFTDVLWKKKLKGGEVRQTITASDVFPPVDLMRWLSLVVCVMIFSLFSVGFVLWKELKQRSNSGTHAAASEMDEKSRFFQFSLVWILLLALTPWAIRYVNPETSAEHIPAIEGFFYFFCVLIAIHADNALVRIEPQKRVPSKATRHALATLFGLGVALTLFSVVDAALGDAGASTFRSPAHFGIWWITPRALLACFGILLIFSAVHWYYQVAARYFKPSSERRVYLSFLVIAFVCFLTYALFSILTLFGEVSFLELTRDFWIYIALLSAVASVIIIVLGYWARAPSAVQHFLKPRLDFLTSPHPDRTPWFRARRITRIFAFFSLAWFWWNLLLAPGLYGNERAFFYFNKTFCDVTGEELTEDSLCKAHVDLQTYFITPVTSLTKQLERYVMFLPAQAYAQGGRDAYSLLGFSNWLGIVNDPRWTVVDSDRQDALLLKVAFASGSPFPIFPPHRIDWQESSEAQQGDSKVEWLVDGGYAHNMPIEAAKKVGADRVLVINSSPVELGSTRDRQGEKFNILGTLPVVLARVIPYFYERSQIEDILSAEDLLVATLSPSADAGSWPFLADFQRKTIERMFREAATDINRRIGMIENWGPPRFSP